MRKAVLAVGLTGGHIYPAKALAEELQSQGWSLLFVARSESLLAEKLLADEGLPLVRLQVEGLTRSLPVALVRIVPFIYKQVCSLVTCLRVMWDWRPDCVVGFGSYVSFPVVLAAKMTGIPVVIYEPNSAMGLANAVLAPLADKVALSLHENRPLQSARWVDVVTPLRKSLKEDAALPGPEAKRSLGLRDDLPCVVIMGGSQGAAAVNLAAQEMIMGRAKQDKGFTFMHITGLSQYDQIRGAYARAGLLGPEGRVEPYWERMGVAYRAADLIIARAGAMTCLEILHFACRALLVPYVKSAEGHQLGNAKYLQRLGIAKILRQNQELALELESAIREMLTESPVAFVVGSKAVGVGAVSLGSVVRSVIKKV
ncbi:MAG: UDP-N-acetylglucosamine--N-acetylmuramyl-(pentapeptide) pyrophosphoryl-undecaprenol N-acetylglucosamine transferase [Elusimicrobiota bacterium]